MPDSAGWKSRIVGHDDRAPQDLIPNSRNRRRHPSVQQRALGTALDEVGWVAEILVNQRTGQVVDGHLRVELAIARGESSVPVTILDLSEEEERLVLATFDPLSAMARTDGKHLQSLLEERGSHDEQRPTAILVCRAARERPQNERCRTERTDGDTDTDLPRAERPCCI